MAYDFIDQNIVASCLIQSHTDDSFYNPVVNLHTGYAFDGTYYAEGVPVAGHPQASWFLEAVGQFRNNQTAFPAFGLVLLSPVSLVILNQSNSVAQASALPLWMQFIFADNYALADNFNGSTQGFLPQSVCYADGIVSVTYSPDAGNQPDGLTHPILTPPANPPSAQSHMVVSIDFTQDRVYLDVAV